jgi:hypothetical protein
MFPQHANLFFASSRLAALSASPQATKPAPGASVDECYGTNHEILVRRQRMSRWVQTKGQTANVRALWKPGRKKDMFVRLHILENVTCRFINRHIQKNLINFGYFHQLLNLS